VTLLGDVLAILKHARALELQKQRSKLIAATPANAEEDVSPYVFCLYHNTAREKESRLCWLSCSVCVCVTCLRPLLSAFCFLQACCGG
jgi:hypothetical protein